MSLPVHLVESLAKQTGSTVVVDGREAHHAVNVRRLRVGDEVVLTDGQGNRVTGVVDATTRQTMTVSVDQRDRTPRPEPDVTVVQALPKGDRGELAVEVLTEVGADTIVPWSAARCVAVWKGERGDKALSRWHATAREAAKQARRNWFPTVEPLATTADVVALLGAADLGVVLHEGGADVLAGLDVPDSGRIVVVVGPEGGLTDEEVTAFTDAGAIPVRLGAEVLRTSTAGVAAVAALLSRGPRWR